MQRRDVALVPSIFLTAALTALGAGGCGEEFEDEPYGYLDLSKSYKGGTPTDPAKGIPREISAQEGFVNGAPAEFYDLGALPVIKDSLTGVPIAAQVHPMYFFFNQEEKPLFSRPAREARDGVDWMRGGHAVLDPTPKDFCAGIDPPTDACKALNGKEKEKQYSARRRDLLVDRFRNVADYQRPIVDVSPEDQSREVLPYTGLWEVVEIIAPNDYVPDSIKHVGTLEKAVASGKLKKRHTGKVINCPIVDERTYIARGVTARDVFRPRIEIWYRRLLGYCFLADGWETLGQSRTKEGNALEFEPELFWANQDDLRLDTFDVNRLVLGSGRDVETRLVVPVSPAYMPAVLSGDALFDPVLAEHAQRFVTSLITGASPRRTAADAPGYSPLRWMFDVLVPPDYREGTWKRVDQVDLSIALPRGLAQGGDAVVRNIATRGVQVPCSHPPDLSRTVIKCGKIVPNPADPDNPNDHVVDPSNDPRCNAIGLECNPDSCHCDVPSVGYGQPCGPGIGRCREKGDEFSPAGYQCFPPWGGFCQLGCSGANELAKENVGKPLRLHVDSRCKEIPGSVCYVPLATCIKFCDTNINAADQCSMTVPVGDKELDISEGMTCQDFGLDVCAWPDGHTPIDFPIP